MTAPDHATKPFIKPLRERGPSIHGFLTRSRELAGGRPLWAPLRRVSPEPPAVALRPLRHCGQRRRHLFERLALGGNGVAGGDEGGGEHEDGGEEVAVENALA